MVERRLSSAERWSAIGDRIADAFGLVLLLIFSTYIMASLVTYHDWGAVAVTTLGVLSATVALGTARASRAEVIWAGRFAALAVALAVVGAIAGGRPWFGLAATLMTLLLGSAALAVLRAVITEEEVGFRTILGAVSVYMSLSLLFAFVFVAVDRFQNQPFFGTGVELHRGDYLFFSTTTLTTTGYGNLVPAGQPGKILATMEMLIGQIFLVTLIARLVSMWRPGQWLREGGGYGARRRGEQE